MTPFPAVFVALGTNLGDREENLARAVRELEDRGFGVTAKSSVYETEPVGGPAQEAYLNAVVQGETSLAPEELLTACLGIERALGRKRTVKNAARTLDLDILLFGDLVMRTGFLTLPHPRLHERRFVLVPLAEIAGHLRHPVLGLTVEELARRAGDGPRVERYGSARMLA